MTLDMRSLYLMLVLIYFAFAILNLSMWAMRRNSAGMRLWGLSNLLEGIGCVLLILRDLVPDWLSITAGNGCIVAGWAILWLGQREFNGHRHNLLWILLPTALVMWLFQFVPAFADPRLRVAVTHTLVILLCCASFADMWAAQRSELLKSRRFLAAVFLTGFGMAAARIGMTVLGPEMASYMDPSVVQSTMQVISLIVAITWNLGLVLMSHERQENLLLQAAQVDALTQALNRAGFENLSARMLQRALRDRQPASVLLMDLDHFKRVNDTHGHAAGDQLLRAFADAARRVLRPTDLLARRGGEEFCAFLPQSTLDQAHQVAERVRREFEHVGVWQQEWRISTTVSIGVAQIRASEPVEQALDRADVALYAAKNAGRNKVSLAEADPLPSQ